jgi:hypothetical protein
MHDTRIEDSQSTENNRLTTTKKSRYVTSEQNAMKTLEGVDLLPQSKSVHTPENNPVKTLKRIDAPAPKSVNVIDKNMFDAFSPDCLSLSIMHSHLTVGHCLSCILT